MEIEELIGSVNIVEYISQYVDLEQRGEEWWGLSPFTNEKTPSFSVREDPPFFYDYSSGYGGNIHTFIKIYHNCNGREAVEILKQYAGCELDGNCDTTKRRKLMATKICEKYKPKKAKAHTGGVVLPDNYMLRFENDPSKLSIWENEGISKESLIKFQVKYDRFSNCIVYPIRDVNGKIVNVGGRALDPNWKERGLRKYTYFYKWGSSMDVVYGLYENMRSIRQNREVIIFEGVKSVLIANSWGIKNTGALLTSHCNPSQVKLLARLGCRVVFALDKDVNVWSDKNIKKLKHYVNVEVILDNGNKLEAKDSPVDKGRDVFIELYNDRLSYR